MLQQSEQLVIAIDVIWVTFCGFLVFLMQLGFAFLEAGSIRLKNLQSILFKNCIDICADYLVWWVLGYGLAFGANDNKFLGIDKFLTIGFHENYYHYLKFFFQWGFASTSATIISGCIAERMPIWSYLAYSMFYSGWIYPIEVHWAWGKGWLNDLGYKDFAGGGMVHLAGGSAGLVATILIGARIDRFSPSKVDDFKPNNITFCVLGSLILWFAWYGFNCGSTFGTMGKNSILIPLIGINTSLSAVSSGLTAVFLHYMLHRNQRDRYSTTVLCNGFLAGLVSITAGCNEIEPFAAVIIGILGGFTYFGSAKLLLRIKVDDPLEASPIHVGCGILSLISVGFFSTENGIFYGGGGKLLGVEILAIVCIFGWVLGNSVLFLLILKKLNILRENAKTEIMGVDNMVLGGSPYNYDNTTIKALQLLKTAEEAGVIQRVVPQQGDIQKEFIKGLEKKAANQLVLEIKQ